VSALACSQPLQAVPTDYTLISFDNDLFSGSDQDYTNGVRLSRIFADKSPDFLPSQLNPLADHLLPEQRGTINGGWFLAQYMFTPEDTDRVDLGPHNRPYAGWLGGCVWLREGSQEHSRSIGLALGMVGPSSLAEQTQHAVHSMLGGTKYPWNDQLHDEPTLNLFLRDRRELTSGEALGFMPYSLHLELGADAGNIRSALLSRALLRFGQYSGVYHFPTERFGPGPEILEESVDEGKFRLAGFVGVEGTATANDIFLDGNTWRDSHSVDRNTYVGTLVWGFDLRWKNWGLAYAFLHQTEEFKGQNGVHSWGSLVLGISF